MIAKKLEEFVAVLIKKEISKSEDKDVIVYGLLTGIELAFNCITTIILGFMFGLLIESVIFLVAYSFLRAYVGGYHCKTAINCYFLSSGIVVLVLAITKFTSNQHMFITSFFVLLVSVPTILRLAPMEATYKPLDELEQKHYRKKAVTNLIIECILIGVLFTLELHTYAFIVCLGIMISSGLLFLQKCFP